MTTLTVSIPNVDALRANFQRAPSITLKYLARATQASIFEVEKQAVDKNFQFKTPRAKRTGYLSLSFAYGRFFDRGGLRGTIGPTAFYAPFVYYGTRRGIQPNPFMERIAAAAQPAIIEQFKDAGDAITRELAAI